MKDPEHVTSDFEKVGPDGPEVVNISGAPSPHTTAVARPNTVAGVPAGPPPGHRTQVEIDAQSGEQYGAATAGRARRVWADAAERLSDPHTRGYLRNVLGLDGTDER